jgi:hypothetical protein
MDLIQRMANAQILAVKLSALISGAVKFSPCMDDYDKRQLLNDLIKYHEENPLDNSPEWIADWKTQLATLSKPVLIEDFPF